MDDDTKGFVFFMASVAVAVIAVIAMLWMLHDFGYRTGQIDALSGQRIMYELRDMPDGTRAWVELEKAKTPQ